MAEEAAFTSSAMATALENSSVSYEDLEDIEKQFDDVETEISKFESMFVWSFKRILSRIVIPIALARGAKHTRCLHSSPNSRIEYV